MALLLQQRRSESTLLSECICASLLGAPSEHLAFDSATGFCRRCVIDLLEHTRYDKENRGLKGLNVGQQILNIWRESKDTCSRKHEVHNEACKNVCDWEEEEQSCIRRVNDIANNLTRACNRCQEVCVGEDNALGNSGGSGGIDNCRDR